MNGGLFGRVQCGGCLKVGVLLVGWFVDEDIEVLDFMLRLFLLGFVLFFEVFVVGVIGVLFFVWCFIWVFWFFFVFCVW